MAIDIPQFFLKLQHELSNVIEQRQHFAQVLQTLVSKDPKNGAMIEQNFLPLIEKYTERLEGWIAKSKNDFLKAKKMSMKRLLALEELADMLESFSNEIKAIISPFISYSETMARRKSELQAFAMETEKKFFDTLLDEIEKLFDEKRSRLYEKIEKEFGLKERLVDSFIVPLERLVKPAVDMAEKTGMKQKVSGAVVRSLEKGLKWAAEKIGRELIDKKVTDNHAQAERAWGKTCGHFHLSAYEWRVRKRRSSRWSSRWMAYRRVRPLDCFSARCGGNSSTYSFCFPSYPGVCKESKEGVCE